jgi:hypothetical protein
MSLWRATIAGSLCNSDGTANLALAAVVAALRQQLAWARKVAQGDCYWWNNVTHLK